MAASILKPLRGVEGERSQTVFERWTFSIDSRITVVILNIRHSDTEHFKFSNTKRK